LGHTLAINGGKRDKEKKVLNRKGKTKKISLKKVKGKKLMSSVQVRLRRKWKMMYTAM